MLKDILSSKNLSVYRVAKDTGISYSTLNDIVIEKTDLKNTSAHTLYRLSKYLEISMEMLYEDAISDTANDSLSESSMTPLVSIWWWTGQSIIGVSTPKNNGASIDGLIHYSDKENHVTLWKKVLMSNYQGDTYKELYNKGFKSIYRGRVYFDPRIASYMITCSKNIINDDNFRKAIIKFCNLENERKEFIPLHHYEYTRELTGNAAVDADYYESSF